MGDVYLTGSSEFLKKLARLPCRLIGDTDGCDNYLTSNFYNLFLYWLKNLLFGNLLKYGNWVNLFAWVLSEGEKWGLNIFCLISRDGVGSMSDNNNNLITFDYSLLIVIYNLEIVAIRCETHNINKVTI